MAHEHSYGATIKNNKTENSAVDFLLLSDSRFRQPTKEERKELLIRLGLPTTFARAFDLVLLPRADYLDILKVPLEEIILLELKTTQKNYLKIQKDSFLARPKMNLGLQTNWVNSTNSVLLVCTRKVKVSHYLPQMN